MICLNRCRSYCCSNRNRSYWPNCCRATVGLSDSAGSTGRCCRRCRRASFRSLLLCPPGSALSVGRATAHRSDAGYPRSAVLLSVVQPSCVQTSLSVSRTWSFLFSVVTVPANPADGRSGASVLFLHPCYFTGTMPHRNHSPSMMTGRPVLSERQAVTIFSSAATYCSRSCLMSYVAALA